ncbi:serine hydrolase domain-containing protein [Enterococcus innesii]|nr:serine hydrolase [Enterococcus innesii]
MNRQELHECISKNQPNICQISAYQNGKEVYSDEWHEYKPEDTCHLMSATKSIVSLLVGIAIDQGLIRSVNDKVLDYFLDYQVKRGEKTIYDITIKHLLTMRAPYKCKGDPWTKVCSSDDWTSASLDLLGGRKGVTNEFNYQTVCLQILTGLLAKASGMTTVDYANHYLFRPLGVAEMTSYYAETAEEHKHFTMDKAPKKPVWFCDPLNIGTAGYGLCLSAKDLAKIGELCLNHGIHQGKQVISSQWLTEMVNPLETNIEKFQNMSYGYLWWILDTEKSTYAAIGNSGNVLYIDPKSEIVIAITAYFKPTVFDRIDFIETDLKPFLFQ